MYFENKIFNKYILQIYTYIYYLKLDNYTTIYIVLYSI